MPNTKSAERRMRVSARRHARNQSVKSRLHTLEKKFTTLAAGGKADDAATALRAATSALDKAARRGVIPKGRANRKKSRLASRLAKAAAPAPAATPAS